MPRRPGVDIRNRCPVERVSPNHVPPVLSNPHRVRPCACPSPPTRAALPIHAHQTCRVRPCACPSPPTRAAIPIHVHQPRRGRPCACPPRIRVTLSFPPYPPVGAGLVPAHLPNAPPCPSPLTPPVGAGLVPALCLPQSMQTIPASAAMNLPCQTVTTPKPDRPRNSRANASKSVI